MCLRVCVLACPWLAMWVLSRQWPAAEEASAGWPYLLQGSTLLQTALLQLHAAWSRCSRVTCPFAILAQCCCRAAPAIAAELSEACFFINLLADDAWQPWALEFFYQSADDAKRAAFLRGAELLSLFCELKQDEGFKRERCGESRTLHGDICIVARKGSTVRGGRCMMVVAAVWRVAPPHICDASACVAVG